MASLHTVTCGSHYKVLFCESGSKPDGNKITLFLEPDSRN